MKTCTKCKVSKNESGFSWRADYPGKLRSHCRDCENIRARGRKNIPVVSKTLNLKKRFGLTLEQWDEMNLLQGGMCAICDGESELCVDHNHRTGQIRGLLCKSCNLSLGLIKDSIVVAQAVVEYLKKHS